MGLASLAPSALEAVPAFRAWEEEPQLLASGAVPAFRAWEEEPQPLASGAVPASQASAVAWAWPLPAVESAWLVVAEGPLLRARAAVLACLLHQARGEAVEDPLNRASAEEVVDLRPSAWEGAVASHPSPASVGGVAERPQKAAAVAGGEDSLHHQTWSASPHCCLPCIRL